MNAKKTKKIVVLATGGTIAGLASDASQPQNYTAGQVNVQDLVGAFAATGIELVTEQVAQIDSKDMTFGLWRTLLGRVSHWLDDEDVCGVVITHGTDTLEETAFFLQTVLRPHKPVALTCAMRPANAPDSDGPGNLHQAFEWVQRIDAQGVAVVCAGHVHRGDAVQKTNSQQRNPFTSQPELTWPNQLKRPTVAQVLACLQWPRVEMVMNHAAADGRLVRAVIAHDAPHGWVVAGTGNGTLSHDLEEALCVAQEQGASVLRASRCTWGGVESRQGDTLPHAGPLTAVQARVALILHLIACA
jgi:L-asparaginase